jgi:hypothetical protein
MPRKHNIKSGEVYGRFKVISEVTGRQSGNVYWNCICECGIKKKVQGRNLKNGLSKSCGCLRNDMLVKRITKHGLSRTPIYTAWRSMKDRCYNKNLKQYKDYGGRGIMVCKRWFKSFDSFRKYMGDEFKEVYELERINVNGDYKKSNCTWVTHKQQQRNKRSNHIVSYKGNKLTIIEWAEITHQKANTILTRIRRGWEVKDALYGKI